MDNSSALVDKMSSTPHNLLTTSPLLRLIQLTHHLGSIVDQSVAMATNGTAVNGMVPVAAATTPVTKICVFCGSMPGADPAHMEAARQLAHKMAENNISLVYGGGTVGLMVHLHHPIFFSQISGVKLTSTGRSCAHSRLSLGPQICPWYHSRAPHDP